MTTPGPLTNLQLLLLTWRVIGGWRSILGGKDFWASVVVTGLCTRLWFSTPWWADVLSVTPSLLGFTLSGFAIFLSFGSDDFKTAISSKDELKSPYVSTSAAFMAFVFFQTASLLYALCAKALAFDPGPLLGKGYIQNLTPVGDALGFLLFVYSLMLALRAALRIFRLSRWLNWYSVVQSQRERPDA
jgi:hypothetical protein